MFLCVISPRRKNTIIEDYVTYEIHISGRSPVCFHSVEPRNVHTLRIIDTDLLIRARCSVPEDPMICTGETPKICLESVMDFEAYVTVSVHKKQTLRSVFRARKLLLA